MNEEPAIEFNRQLIEMLLPKLMQPQANKALEALEKAQQLMADAETLTARAEQAHSDASRATAHARACVNALLWQLGIPPIEGGS